MSKTWRASVKLPHLQNMLKTAVSKYMSALRPLLLRCAYTFLPSTRFFVWVHLCTSILYMAAVTLLPCCSNFCSIPWDWWCPVSINAALVATKSDETVVWTPVDGSLEAVTFAAALPLLLLPVRFPTLFSVNLQTVSDTPNIKQQFWRSLLELFRHLLNNQQLENRKTMDNHLSNGIHMHLICQGSQRSFVPVPKNQQTTHKSQGYCLDKPTSCEGKWYRILDLRRQQEKCCVLQTQGIRGRCDSALEQLLQGGHRQLHSFFFFSW